jgi:hypothetical protein
LGYAAISLADSKVLTHYRVANLGDFPPNFGDFVGILGIRGILGEFESFVR